MLYEKFIELIDQYMILHVTCFYLKFVYFNLKRYQCCCGYVFCFVIAVKLDMTEQLKGFYSSSLYEFLNLIVSRLVSAVNSGRDSFILTNTAFSTMLSGYIVLLKMPS